ncbi:unnamed protein product [Closterium sp. NIES-64]|nr:unnamed protein product [Closterium sp. NIES-64]
MASAALLQSCSSLRTPFLLKNSQKSLSADIRPRLIPRETVRSNHPGELLVEGLARAERDLPCRLVRGSRSSVRCAAAGEGEKPSSFAKQWSRTGGSSSSESAISGAARRIAEKGGRGESRPSGGKNKRGGGKPARGRASGDAQQAGENGDGAGAEGEAREGGGSGRRERQKRSHVVLEPAEFPEPMSRDPHVAILGGGMAGLMCALGLAERGIRSTVFDTGGSGPAAGVHSSSKGIVLREQGCAHPAAMPPASSALPFSSLLSSTHLCTPLSFHIDPIPPSPFSPSLSSSSRAFSLSSPCLLPLRQGKHGLGGRMATREVEVAGKLRLFDHAAQFFTVTDSRFQSYVDRCADSDRSDIQSFADRSAAFKIGRYGFEVDGWAASSLGLAVSGWQSRAEVLFSAAVHVLRWPCCCFPACDSFTASITQPHSTSLHPTPPHSTALHPTPPRTTRWLKEGALRVWEEGRIGTLQAGGAFSELPTLGGGGSSGGGEEARRLISPCGMRAFCEHVIADKGGRGGWVERFLSRLKGVVGVERPVWVGNKGEAYQITLLALSIQSPPLPPYPLTPLFSQVREGVVGVERSVWVGKMRAHLTTVLALCLLSPPTNHPPLPMTPSAPAIPCPQVREGVVGVERPVWIGKMRARGGKWVLEETGRKAGEFDFVVIAHNGKCANRLLAPAGIPKIARQMKRLELSSIWASIIAFEKPLLANGSTTRGHFDAAFVEGVPAVSWMCNNTAKLGDLGGAGRGDGGEGSGAVRRGEGMECWTVFSSAAYGKRNKVPQENIPLVRAARVKEAGDAGERVENIPLARAARVKEEMLEGVAVALGGPIVHIKHTWENIPLARAARVKEEMLEGVAAALGRPKDSLPAVLFHKIQLWGAALPLNAPTTAAGSGVECIMDASTQVGLGAALPLNAPTTAAGGGVECIMDASTRVGLGAALPLNAPTTAAGGGVECIMDASTRVGLCGDWLLAPSVQAAAISGLAMADKVLLGGGGAVQGCSCCGLGGLSSLLAGAAVWRRILAPPCRLLLTLGSPWPIRGSSVEGAVLWSDSPMLSWLGALGFAPMADRSFSRGCSGRRPFLRRLKANLFMPSSLLLPPLPWQIASFHEDEAASDPSLFSVGLDASFAAVPDTHDIGAFPDATPAAADSNGSTQGVAAHGVRVAA